MCRAAAPHMRREFMLVLKIGHYLLLAANRK
jgi:hypothetical protein